MDTALAVAVAGLAVAAVALGFSLLALRRTVGQRRRGREVPPDLESLARAATELRADMGRALRHLAVVRYDAFGDMGGHLSWSLALLDDEGDGMVVTAIHGRADTRTYAKNVAGWTGAQQLSPEESEAVALARRG
ncbi:MAG: hypothetical protein K0Q93_1794 [Nocardioidaceae bacterium]|nr:hypothetical protein [Nocardioidaceae bacterium]